jgi:hypothetical protein
VHLPAFGSKKNLMIQSKIAIIGSGPSAFAALAALKEKNISIDIIDAGNTVSDGQKVKSKRKLVNNSDFVYRNFYDEKTQQDESVDYINSFAVGGLSNVWGATVHPKLLIEGGTKKTFFSLIPVTRVADITKKEFPGLSIDKSIKKGNITVHDSSCLVEDTQDKCRLCSLCLDGCPYRLIWNSSHELNGYRNEGRINYHAKYKCLKLNIEHEKITIITSDKSGNQFDFGLYDKVLLATGPLETFRILSESNILDSNEAGLDQTDTFYILVRNDKDLKLDNRFGLAQLHLEINGEADLWIQLSAFSKSHIKILKSRFPFLSIFPENLLMRIFKKYSLGIGYIGVDNSSSLKFIYLDNNLVSIKAKLVKNRELITRVLKENSQDLDNLGLKIIHKTLQVLPVGGGAHYGNLNLNGENINSYLKKRNLLDLIEVIDLSSVKKVDLGPTTVLHMNSIFERFL